MEAKREHESVESQEGIRVAENEGRRDCKGICRYIVGI